MSYGSTTIPPICVEIGITPLQASQLKDLFDDLQHITDKNHLPGISETFSKMMQCYLKQHPGYQSDAWLCFQEIQYLLVAIANTGNLVDFGHNLFSKVSSKLEGKEGRPC